MALSYPPIIAPHSNSSSSCHPVYIYLMLVIPFRFLLCSVPYPSVVLLFCGFLCHYSPFLYSSPCSFRVRQFFVHPISFHYSCFYSLLFINCVLYIYLNLCYLSAQLLAQSDLHCQVLHPGKQIGKTAVCLNIKNWSFEPDSD